MFLYVSVDIILCISVGMLERFIFKCALVACIIFLSSEFPFVVIVVVDLITVSIFILEAFLKCLVILDYSFLLKSEIVILFRSIFVWKSSQL